MSLATWHVLAARVPFWPAPPTVRTSTVRPSSMPHTWFSVRCLIFGHDDQLGREQHRLFLRCADCGRCTSGWVIGTNAPRMTAPVARRVAPRLRESRGADVHRQAATAGIR